MKILTVPDSKLRQKSQDVLRVDKKLVKLVTTLQSTLEKKENPRGVGLAAPQIGSDQKVFVTLLPDKTGSTNLKTTVFINPMIVDHADKLIVGENLSAKKPREEGCLSIPKIYGVVPRWQWVKFAYQQIKHGELVTTETVFSDFPARVMQHEYDHLFGILFTDKILEYKLPVYKEISADKWEEIDPKALNKF